MSGVVIENLAKAFADRNGEVHQALRDIHLTVASGELVVLVGPSGSGKTTLLRIIAGVEQPTGGRVSIGGRLMTGVPPEDRGVAMVFQEHTLYPHLSVGENLGFALTLRKYTKSEINARVTEAAETLGIASILNRKPDAISGGERRRVALGRTLVLRANVVLLDEPLANLDAPWRAQMRREIRQLQRQLGATMIYVTHDQGEAMSLADRVAVMENGSIRQTGSPDELYHRPVNLFVAGFLGSPPMNLICGALVQDSNSTQFIAGEGSSPGDAWVWNLPRHEAGALAPAVSGRQPVVMGLRPESIRVGTPGEGAGAVAGVQARVEAIESFGWETHVHLRLGRTIVVARMIERVSARQGDLVTLELDMTRAHWFDATNGTALT